MNKRWLILGLVAGVTVVGLVIGGYFVWDLRRETTDIQGGVGIVGRIESSMAKPGRVRVYLLQNAVPGESVSKVIGMARPGVSGLFVFLASASSEEYRLAAYDDVNGNLRYDIEEPSWTSAASEPIAPRETGSASANVIRINLQVDTNADQTSDSTVLDAVAGRDESGGSVPVVMGDVVTLDDDRLQAGDGVAGLWRPTSSLLQRGLGIYFLQRFDPDRTPVLFVHGAAGTPQDFAWLIEQLDTRQFQPWVFAYPSGLPLSIASDALARMTAGLALQYDISRVHLVAHSMGGLVARAALINLERDEVTRSLVDRLVTISTPFGGHEAVSMGAEHSPVTVPSWFDIKEDSPFIQAVSATRVSASHLLIYGHSASERFFLPEENDGSVSVKSQLHPPVRAWAQSVEAHDETHTSILSTQAVLKQIQAHLAASPSH